MSRLVRLESDWTANQIQFVHKCFCTVVLYAELKCDWLTNQIQSCHSRFAFPLPMSSTQYQCRKRLCIIVLAGLTSVFPVLHFAYAKLEAFVGRLAANGPTKEPLNPNAVQ